MSDAELRDDGLEADPSDYGQGIVHINYRQFRYHVHHVRQQFFYLMLIYMPHTPILILVYPLICASILRSLLLTPLQQPYI